MSNIRDFLPNVVKTEVSLDYSCSFCDLPNDSSIKECTFCLKFYHASTCGVENPQHCNNCNFLYLQVLRVKECETEIKALRRQADVNYSAMPPKIEEKKSKLIQEILDKENLQFENVLESKGPEPNFDQTDPDFDEIERLQKLLAEKTKKYTGTKPKILKTPVDQDNFVASVSQNPTQNLNSTPIPIDFVQSLTLALQNGITSGFQTGISQTISALNNKPSHTYDDLPSFDGKNILLFPAWLSKAKQIFDGKSNGQVLDILRKCLKDNAYRLVERFMTNENNVEKISDILRTEYGRPEKHSKIFEDRLYKCRAALRADKDLIFLNTLLEEFISAMENTNSTSLLKNDHLCNLVLSKLPEIIRYEWEKLKAEKIELLHSVKSNKFRAEPLPQHETQSLCDIRDFLVKYVIIAQNAPILPSKLVQPIRNPINVHVEKKTTNNSKLHTKHKCIHKDIPKVIAELNSYEPTNKKCPLCEEKFHFMYACETFKKLALKERWSAIRKLNVCGYCLKSSFHKYVDCKSKKQCSVNGCEQYHHPMLHSDGRHVRYKRSKTNQISEAPPSKSFAPITNNQISTTPQPTQDTSKPQPMLVHKYEEGNPRFQILPITLFSGEKEPLKTFAMIDNGSSCSLIDQSIAEKLEITGTRDPLSILWSDGSVQEHLNSERVTLCTSGTTHGKRFEIENVRTVSDLKLPTQSQNASELKKFEHLKDLHLPNFENARPMILLGLRHAYFTAPDEIRKGKSPYEPIAIKTLFGWAVYGSSDDYENNCSLNIQEIDPETLNWEKLIHDFFELENLGIKLDCNESLTDQEKRAEMLMEKYMYHDGKRYMVPLLWETDEIFLKDNFYLTLKRLEFLEKQLEKNPALKKFYCEKLETYIKDGFLRKLSKSEASVKTWRTNYIPHFATINPKKAKPRIVLDAAAGGENALNAHLLKGQDLITSLLSILIQFRLHKFAFIGDVREMFSNIGIIQIDQQAQRILWRNCDTTIEPEEYVFTRMLFGPTDSPFKSQYVKNYNANLFKDSMPLGSEAIINHTYVDDLAVSYPSQDIATQAALESIKIYENGGFQIRNFVSNSSEILQALPSENVAIQEEHSLNLLSNTPILGMSWLTNKDTLVIRFDANNIDKDLLSGNRTPTKREVLSINGSIFDPLGIVAFITFSGKLLFQKICKETTKWDDKISNSCFIEWLNWLSKLSEINKIKIPRCYSQICETKSDTTYELNTFVDASQNVYAAVVYLVTKNSGQMDVSFVFGKSKVANKTLNTIPKLELQAALLGIRITNSTKLALKLNISTIRFFSDSEIVLHQINNLNKKQNPFQHARVKEIREHSLPEQWFHIPSELNPADSGTKPKTNPTWISGPSFLKSEKNSWPDSIVNISSKQETLHVNVEKVKKFDLIKPENFSSFRRMVKILVLVKKQFLRFAKKPVNPNITAEEVKWARMYLIKQAQFEAFGSEIEQIESKENISKGPLKSLNPYFDDFGILRCNGRLQNAECIAESSRNPIILPKGGRIKDLLLREYHEKYFHHGQNSVKAAILRKYWPIGLNQSLRKAIYNCQLCKNKAAKPNAPQMANLPPCRLQPFAKPFTYTGVDYMGPFDVTIGRRREKRWVALFTCLTFRCCHLEIAYDLSADSFLICLENLLSRRGAIKEIFSDNATNFVGAANLIERELAYREIKFTRIPPASPHFGGAWEKLVHLTKKTLNMLFNEHAPREHTFISFLYQAEFICNSRPLTEIALESLTQDVLTPNHFLFGPLGGEIPEVTYGPELEASKKQLDIMVSFARRFRNRFNSEVIPLLNLRKKWPNKCEPLKIGDVVVILDDDKFNKSFVKGIITEIFKANDGQVRFANVKTATGLFKRPAVKIAVLDVKRESQSTPTEKVSKNTDLQVATQAIRSSISDTQINPVINTQTPTTDNAKMPHTRSRRLRNRNPINYKHFFLMFLFSFMANTSAVTIDMINESGLFMAHVNFVYSQTGIAEWTVNTGIDIKQDDDHFMYQLGMLKLMCSRADEIEPTINCTSRIQYLSEIRRFIHEDAKQLRFKRETGAIMWLIHYLFGSSSTQDEIEELQAKEKQYILETKKVLQTTAEKFDKTTKITSKKVQDMQYILQNTTQLIKTYYQSYAKQEVMEKIDEAIQVIELYIQDLKIKYDSVRSGLTILSDEEIEQSIHKIRTEMRDFSILPPVNNSVLIQIAQQEIEIVENMIVIRVYLPILYYQRFEQYQLVAIPNFETGKIMDVPQKYVCVDPITKTYFYPKDTGVHMSKDTVIINNNVFLTAQANSNCIAKVFVKTLHQKQHCNEVKTLEDQTTVIIPLPKHHQYIFYTNEPTSISLSCNRGNNKQTLNPIVEKNQKFTAGMINAEPGCVIYSPGQFIVSNTEDRISTKLSQVFFHPFTLPNVTNSSSSDQLLLALESKLKTTDNSTESPLLDDVKDQLQLFPDTNFRVHHVISGTSIALLVLTFIAIGLYFCLKKKPININVTPPANTSNNQMMSSVQMPFIPRIPQSTT